MRIRDRLAHLPRMVMAIAFVLAMLTAGKAMAVEKQPLTPDGGFLRRALGVQFEAANRLCPAPVDASLTFDDEAGCYVINEGVPWGAFDIDRATNLVMQVFESGDSPNRLVDCRAAQIVTSADSALVAACDQANAYLESSFDLQVQGATVAAVDDVLVHSWILIDDGLNVSLDEQSIATWVDGVETSIDNVGGTRTYVRSDGKQVTVNGGTYGWISNGAETEQLVVNLVMQGFVGVAEIPMKQQAAVYNPGGADWGARYVDVDLTEQRVRFYEADGTLVNETPVITGTVLQPGYETPEGVYAITGKAQDVVLIGLPDQNGIPSYEVPVDYWMPFIDNMIGLHDAAWQSWWSPEAYRSGAGSHGCVNLPVDVAAWAYDWLEVGTPVVVHY